MKSWPGQPVDETFLDTGLQLFVIDTVVSTTPDAVWKRLATRDREQFIPGIRGTWVTPPPSGPGARRTITLAGVTEFEEHYFCWDNFERRWALYISRFGVPGLSTLAEEVTVSAHPDGTRITWRVVTAETAVLRWLSKIAKPILSSGGHRLMTARFVA